MHSVSKAFGHKKVLIMNKEETNETEVKQEQAEIEVTSSTRFLALDN